MHWQDDKILLWIDVFSKPDSSFRSVKNAEDITAWRPQNEEERNAFDALIAKDNRDLLKSWYAKFVRIEGPHDLFRRMLEKAIGEDIPIREK